MKPPTKSGLIVPSGRALAKVPVGDSSALSEIINRSLLHIQTSKTLEMLQHGVSQDSSACRVAGDEQEFEIAPGVRIVMCWIPPGEFLMGSPEHEEYRRGDEIQHRVRITQGFWLAKTQTTQDQWQAVMGSNPSYFTGENLPLHEVCWDDICGDSERDGGFVGTVNSFSNEGGLFDLPTEAQWEYSCRAGISGTLAVNLDEVAWYVENSGQRPHPVGEKKSNAWGLHDMLGNMQEWCADWYGSYDRSEVTDPTGPKSGLYRVVRGGSSSDTCTFCRAADRYKYDHDCYISGAFGFRIMRSASEQLNDRLRQNRPM
jgi:formylglycine-generating enzyme required for sulfatase activity